MHGTGHLWDIRKCTLSVIGNDFSHITCMIETLTWVANEVTHTATKQWTNVKNYIQHRYPQKLN